MKHKIMSRFIHENFLLQSPAAIRLYHDFAAEMPIIDYHCHLSPKDIAEDRRFENLTQIWLAGDHYKWRAMRAAGVSEEYITGNASDWEKFQAWAEVVPKTLRNPLYHWTHLELNRPFGINDRLLGPDTAKSIWDECNAKLQSPEFSARGIMRQMNVRLVCTTDDPVDSLEHHQKIAADKSFDIKVLPTFRPDKVMQFLTPRPDGGEINEQSMQTYNVYLNLLAEAAGMEINTFDDFTAALQNRHDYFHANGCRLSDNGFEFLFRTSLENDEDAHAVFSKLRTGEVLLAEEVLCLAPEILHHIGKMNAEKGWTMQLHIGAIRNNNTRFYRQIGVDAGFDSIADNSGAENDWALSKLFDRLDIEEKLPKTIVYNLNPSWNDMLVTMLGNFQDGKTPGKMQFGSGWWFLDQKKGMEDQLNALSNHGLLSLFVGMLTDSRSFLSYTRHEYFRRILCNLLGDEIEQGMLPHDFELIGNMVRDICYNNASRYFGFERHL